MPLLHAKNLRWAPPDRHRVRPPLFSNLNLQLHAGESLAVQGSSGSGKSTLLRCLCLLEPVLEGEVLWRGKTVGAENVRAFRNRVVYVHQRPIAIAPRIDENLDYPRQVTSALFRGAICPLSCAEQRTLLDRLGLADIEITRDFEELSLGEQQRVALVRCLTTRPDILLLDEPTASLDPKNAERVETLLREYLAEKPDERALIWISHQQEQLERVSTRSISMDQFSTAT